MDVKSTVKRDYIYVDDAASLVCVCERLRYSTWLAIDTEFERVSTYYPELCLLQIANGTEVVIIDPLAIDDLEPLFALLYDNAITKVFHSARQDLELFFHLKGKVPLPLFDTQLAAPLLDYDATMGYANLVKAMLGVELSKSQTRTNWKRRPLKEKQLRYAADDVIYLGRIYEIMFEKLAASGQLESLGQQLAALARPEVYVPDPADQWVKIREAKRFSGTNLSVLQQLTSWREETARSENLPRKWVLPDRAIIDMARLLPTDADALAEVKSVTTEARQKYGPALLSRIVEAQRMPPRPVPAARITPV